MNLDRNTLIYVAIGALCLYVVFRIIQHCVGKR